MLAAYLSPEGVISKSLAAFLGAWRVQRFNDRVAQAHEVTGEVTGESAQGAKAQRVYGV